MKVIDFDGNTHNINVAKYKLREVSKSKEQEKLKEILLEYYASYIILEEFCIPKVNLYLDFYIPVRKIAFEFDGRQHSKFVKHFHGDISGFNRQVSNDKLKLEWCTLNNIALIRFTSVPSSIEEFKRRLYGQ